MWKKIQKNHYCLHPFSCIIPSVNDVFQDEFAGDGVDLYDDVIAAPAGGNGGVSSANSGDGGGDTTSPNEETNGSAPYHQLGNNIQPNQIGRRHQLYVGNLTWVSC